MEERLHPGPVTLLAPELTPSRGSELMHILRSWLLSANNVVVKLLEVLGGDLPGKHWGVDNLLGKRP